MLVRRAPLIAASRPWDLAQNSGHAQKKCALSSSWEMRATRPFVASFCAYSGSSSDKTNKNTQNHQNAKEQTQDATEDKHTKITQGRNACDQNIYLLIERVNAMRAKRNPKRQRRTSHAEPAKRQRNTRTFIEHAKQITYDKTL
jgi:hypothetical protein